ncbi:hypothetical protein ARMGADRAFT_1086279 [Armillaria gallica]|uniref:Uncharacterized protein n=1 Tax=Armillaria gallica TaxID=47427 RepID=A0A2H3DH55_ARMGA|nr:hypothetical protein ARMGADRAFT_1086279 [Armillaria gallica]
MLSLPDILQEYFNKGQTCSQCVFSSWNTTPIVVPDPEFDFAKLVKQHMEEEDQLAKLDVYDLFDSHSPLSTPPMSPELGPTANFIELPTELSSLPLPADPLGPRAQLPSGLGSQCRAKEQSKANHCHKRKWEREEMTALDYKPHPQICVKHTLEPEAIATSFKTHNMPHASTAYLGTMRSHGSTSTC